MKLKIILPTLLTLLLAVPAFAVHHETSEKSLFTTVYVSTLNSEAEKIVQLAEAIDEADYGWRPQVGVSTVQDLLIHMASANYYIGSSILGGTVPEGVNVSNLEATAIDKASSIETYKESVDFLNEVVSQMSEESLAETVNIFGKEAPRMTGTFLLHGHNNQHLGSLITYARCLGITPPWSK